MTPAAQTRRRSADRNAADETGLAHYYATAHGSAEAAIEAIESARDWHDATTRVLLRDLGTMRHAERQAALCSPSQQVAA